MTESKQLTDTTHELRGLEADNLLAFLALLGLLRALERARPQWMPRVLWRSKPPVAVLQLSAAVTRDDVVRGANQGVCDIGQTYEVTKDDITFTEQEFREVAKQARNDGDRALLVASLASDGALRRNGETVESTPLCAMFGQGHQHFLQRLTRVAKQKDPQDIEKLSHALFAPWMYDDDTDAFRWDPIEDRRYAHQFGDPSDGKNKMGTVAGANRLAAIGFALLTCVPGTSGLITVAVAGRRRGERDVCWPIVRVPVSLAAYVALLKHPSLTNEEDVAELAAYGVEAIARVRRFQVGKFFNFERARIQYLS